MICRCGVLLARLQKKGRRAKVTSGHTKALTLITTTIGYESFSIVPRFSLSNNIHTTHFPSKPLILILNSRLGPENSQLIGYDKDC